MIQAVSALQLAVILIPFFPRERRPYFVRQQWTESLLVWRATSFMQYVGCLQTPRKCLVREEHRLTVFSCREWGTEDGIGA